LKLALIATRSRIESLLSFLGCIGDVDKLMVDVRVYAWIATVQEMDGGGGGCFKAFVWSQICLLYVSMKGEG